MSDSFTTKQVAEHASVENGLYIIIDGSVYALDKFVDEHPGGAKILKRVGGKDASKQFWKVSYHASYHKAKDTEKEKRRGMGGREEERRMRADSVSSTTTKACSRSTALNSSSAPSRRRPSCRFLFYCPLTIPCTS